MSSLLYPGLQALDEHYLDVHFQFGGADQVRTRRDACRPEISTRRAFPPPSTAPPSIAPTEHRPVPLPLPQRSC